MYNIKSKSPWMKIKQCFGLNPPIDDSAWIPEDPNIALEAMVKHMEEVDIYHEKLVTLFI